jgi:hypothetical protein
MSPISRKSTSIFARFASGTASQASKSGSILVSFVAVKSKSCNTPRPAK